MNKRVLSLLSLCQKAGKLCTGESNCEKALKENKARLVIIAEDASENTKKKFTNKAFYYQVKTLNIGTRDELSKAIGKMNRVTLIITDENFANKIIEMIEL